MDKSNKVIWLFAVGILFVLIVLLASSLYTVTALKLDTSMHNTIAFQTVENDVTYPLGMVAVGDTYTVGLCANGEICFTGEDKTLRDAVTAWTNIGIIASNSDTIAGLSKDGKLQFVGEDAESFAAAGEWENVTCFAMSDDHVAAVLRDGSVVAIGNNTSGKCGTEVFHSAVSVVAGHDFTAVLNCFGVVRVVGNEEIASAVLEWNDITQITAGNSFVVGLDESGTVYSTNSKRIPKENSGIAQVYAGADGIVCIGENGKLICRKGGEKITGQNNVAYCVIGNRHTVVMQHDGSVMTYGETDNGQGRTILWDMRIKTEDMYLTGFAFGMSVATARDIIAAETQCDNVQIYDDSDEAVSDTVCKTGLKAYVDDEFAGEFVLYGDVDCDGKVTDSDANCVRKHIDALSAEDMLTGASLVAADTLNYVSGVHGLNEEHINSIKEIADGSKNMEQHKSDPLKESTQTAYARNHDVVGWIRVSGTNVDYPILYGPNYFYNYYTIDRVPSGRGSIYPLRGEWHKNNVVAGHNARPTQTMFHQLHSVQNRGKDLKKYNNRIFEVSIYGEYSEWEIFALYEVGPYEPNTTILYNINSFDSYTDSEIEEWIQTQLSRSEIDIGVVPTPDEEFLTLYTCGDIYYYDRDNQARLYIFLRRIA